MKQLYLPIFEQLEDDVVSCNQIQIASIEINGECSLVVNKAMDDARIALNSGHYSSAIDRIHTAFDGFLREILRKHNITYNDSDTLSKRYSELHKYYEGNIEPVEVGRLVKTILRSASGIVDSLNNIRNNYSLAHPNASIIEERKAKLAIQLVYSIIDYIREVEECIAQK